MLKDRYEARVVQDRLVLPSELYWRISADPQYERIFVVKTEDAGREFPHLEIRPEDSFRLSELDKPKSRGDVYETEIYLPEKIKKPKIHLTREFQEFAGLEKEVMIVSILNILEVWNPIILTENLNYIGKNFSDICERLYAFREIWGDYFMQQRRNPPIPLCQSPSSP